MVEYYREGWKVYGRCIKGEVTLICVCNDEFWADLIVASLRLNPESGRG